MFSSRSSSSSVFISCMFMLFVYVCCWHAQQDWWAEEMRDAKGRFVEFMCYVYWFSLVIHIILYVYII